MFLVLSWYFMSTSGSVNESCPGLPSERWFGFRNFSLRPTFPLPFVSWPTWVLDVFRPIPLLGFRNHFLLTGKIGHVITKRLVAFDILHSASGATFHESSNGRPTSNENQTVSIHLYSDYGLTKRETTRALHRTLSRRNTPFAFRKANNFCVHGDRRSLLVLVPDDWYYLCVDQLYWTCFRVGALHKLVAEITSEYGR